MQAEHPLVGGFVNSVVRVGNEVRRSTGPWTPAIHALLGHLEAVGFDEAPRVLGIDEKSRERLTFIDGTSIGWSDWPKVMISSEGLAKLGHLLGHYHEAVRSFKPLEDAVWRNPLAPKSGELIRHGDFSPFNAIWRNDDLVGIVDWDFAQPGDAISDLAYLAWYAVPLMDDHRLVEFGLQVVDRVDRFRSLCAAYGVHEPAAVAAEAVRIIKLEALQTVELAGRGIHPWVRFAADGNPKKLQEEAGWIENWRAAVAL